MKREPKQHDMTPQQLPSCWGCGKSAKFAVIASEVDEPGSENKHPDYKPIVWRYWHKSCYKPHKEELHASLPLTYVSWIDLTLRLLDQKGEDFLFKYTNWRFVLDCVSQDYLPAINEYVNPEPKTAAAKPKRVLKRRKP